MGLFEISFIGIGLAADAFAVSVCKGLSMRKFILKNAIIIGLYFGIFQALMPLLGYYLGVNFQSVVESIDHWIAFILLSIIGGKMVIESMNSKKVHEEDYNENINFKTMFLLALATSIDALAVGITMAFLEVNIFRSIVIIGSITLVLSMAGVKIGNKFGDKFQNKAEIIGGIILILIGTKILLSHLGFF